MRDKDFIKIDDLFKGRPDREENIPPGAWRNMQDLLEKAAVTGGAGGGNYGWYAVFALLTLGLGSSAVIFQNKTIQEQATVKNELSANSVNTNTFASSQTTAYKASNDMSTASTKENKADENTVAKNNNSNNNYNNKSISKNTIKQTNSISDAVGAPATAAYSSSTNKITRKQSRAINKKNKQEDLVNSAIINRISDKNKIAERSVQTQNSIASSTDLALEKIELTKFAPVLANDSNYAAVVQDEATKTKFVLPKTEKAWKKEVNAKVNEIERTVVTYKDASGANKYRIDTVKNTSSRRNILLALSQKEKMNLVAIASTKPSAALIESRAPVSNTILSVENSVSVSNANILVPISNFKVKTISTRSNFISRFNEVMSQYIGGEKPYYLSGNIGIQSLFSNQQATGFHIGIAGHYDFKERYTLSAELNYAFNKFSTNNISDEFTAYTNQSLDTSGLYPIYSASEQRFVNQFSLQSVSSFNLPVTVRYQLSKWAVLGGVYFNYNLATKYSSLMNQNETGTQSVHSLTPFQSSTPNIATQDFKNRMGMGLVAGITYDFNKNMSIDLRASQNLWNSIKSQSHFSKNLYRTTGVQLSLYYFLGRKDKVVYMMNSK